MAAAITRPEELLDVLGLDRSLLPAACAASQQYRMLAPRGFVALMKRSDPDDPLLRQILPQACELRDAPGFGTDPLNERAVRKAPGLLQKYRGRALLLITSACAVHCRYCFRRHIRSGRECADAGVTAEALRRLAGDVSISEVILSGGDPLLLDDAALAALTARLGALSHLRRLRLHTRIPVVLPARITEALCRILGGSRLRTVVVVHANHPRELGTASRNGLAQLRRAGIRLLNQSVLLKGVNDEPEVLAELSEALFDCGVQPYYLHMLDRVAGAAHFDLDEQRALELVHALQSLLSGYLVPRLVRDVVGRPYKTPIDAEIVQRRPFS